jgi:NAD(P)-dependent dehydrogenase (short-subunit alcohol dehydrogenase family)
MVKRNSGRILNVASLAANGVPFNTLYSASKAALVGACRALRRELHMRKATGVTVVCSMPGYTATPLLNNVASSVDFATSGALAEADLDQFGSRLLMASQPLHHLILTLFDTVQFFLPDCLDAPIFELLFTPGKTRPLAASTAGMAPHSFPAAEQKRVELKALQVEL